MLVPVLALLLPANADKNVGVEEHDCTLYVLDWKRADKHEEENPKPWSVTIRNGAMTLPSEEDPRVQQDPAETQDPAKNNMRKRKACHFPFTYQGIKHTTCVKGEYNKHGSEFGTVGQTKKARRKRKAVKEPWVNPQALWRQHPFSPMTAKTAADYDDYEPAWCAVAVNETGETIDWRYCDPVKKEDSFNLGVTPNKPLDASVQRATFFNFDLRMAVDLTFAVAEEEETIEKDIETIVRKRDTWKKPETKEGVYIHRINKLKPNFEGWVTDLDYKTLLDDNKDEVEKSKRWEIKIKLQCGKKKALKMCENHEEFEYGKEVLSKEMQKQPVNVDIQATDIISYHSIEVPTCNGCRTEEEEEEDQERDGMTTYTWVRIITREKRSEQPCFLTVGAQYSKKLDREKRPLMVLTTPPFHRLVRCIYQYWVDRYWKQEESTVRMVEAFPVRHFMPNKGQEVVPLSESKVVPADDREYREEAADEWAVYEIKNEDYEADDVAIAFDSPVTEDNVDTVGYAGAQFLNKWLQDSKKTIKWGERIMTELQENGGYSKLFYSTVYGIAPLLTELLTEHGVAPPEHSEDETPPEHSEELKIRGVKKAMRRFYERDETLIDTYGRRCTASISRIGKQKISREEFEFRVKHHGIDEPVTYGRFFLGQNAKFPLFISHEDFAKKTRSQEGGKDSILLYPVDRNEDVWSSNPKAAVKFDFLPREKVDDTQQWQDKPYLTEKEKIRVELDCAPTAVYRECNVWDPSRYIGEDGTINIGENRISDEGEAPELNINLRPDTDMTQWESAGKESWVRVWTTEVNTGRACFFTIGRPRQRASSDRTGSHSQGSKDKELLDKLLKGVLIPEDDWMEGSLTVPADTVFNKELDVNLNRMPRHQKGKDNLNPKLLVFDSLLHEDNKFPRLGVGLMRGNMKHYGGEAWDAEWVSFFGEPEPKSAPKPLTLIQKTNMETMLKKFMYTTTPSVLPVISGKGAGHCKETKTDVVVNHWRKLGYCYRVAGHLAKDAKKSAQELMKKSAEEGMDKLRSKKTNRQTDVGKDNEKQGNISKGVAGSSDKDKASSSASPLPSTPASQKAGSKTNRQTVVVKDIGKQGNIPKGVAGSIDKSAAGSSDKDKASSSDSPLSRIPASRRLNLGSKKTNRQTVVVKDIGKQGNIPKGVAGSIDEGAAGSSDKDKASSSDSPLSRIPASRRLKLGSMKTKRQTVIGA